MLHAAGTQAKQNGHGLTHVPPLTFWPIPGLWPARALASVSFFVGSLGQSNNTMYMIIITVWADSSLLIIIRHYQ